jgi:hypothetical protein
MAILIEVNVHIAIKKFQIMPLNVHIVRPIYNYSFKNSKLKARKSILQVPKKRKNLTKV